MQGPSGVPRLAAERQRSIAEQVRERGSVRAAELAAGFDVTAETIRRDLMALEERGLVRRAHGGAVAAAGAEASFTQRLGVREAEKLAIAARAANLVGDGMRILIDSGTTTLALARMLRQKRGLVVVTNALSHASELMRNPETTVILTSGVLRRSTLGAVGDLAIDALEQLRVDRAFVAIHSVSAADGLTYPSFEEVGVKRAMIAASGDVTLLADSSKVGRTSLFQVAPIAALRRLVTDGQVDADEAARIREAGVEVVLASPAVATGDPPHPAVGRGGSRH
jgi:DeoR family transcriptional regulator, fructose operon transcriptional repressor